MLRLILADLLVRSKPLMCMRFPVVDLKALCGFGNIIKKRLKAMQPKKTVCIYTGDISLSR